MATLKEALIKSNVQIAPSDFSSDCQKRRRNTDVFQGVFGENDGKYANKMCVQPVGRDLFSGSLKTGGTLCPFLLIKAINFTSAERNTL